MLNRGVAFGLLPGISWVVAALVWLVVLCVLWRSKRVVERLGLSMILIGGASNILSRYLNGGVVDSWNLFGLLYNNLADYLIVVGLVVYGYSYFVRGRGDSSR